MLFGRKIPEELREYYDQNIKIEFKAPEIKALTNILKAFGIKKSLRKVLNESHLVVTGVGIKNKRKLLSVFHPAAHFLVVLESGAEGEPLKISKAKKPIFFTSALPGMLKTVEKPSSNVEVKYSEKLVRAALNQHYAALSNFKKNLPFLELKPSKDLIKASETMIKTQTFKEIEKNLLGYLKTGKTKRLIKPKQIKLL